MSNDSLFYYTNNTTPTKDGNLLTCGQYVKNFSPYPSGGFLIKFDYNGNLLWQKLYDSISHPKNHWLYYYRAIELQDKTILLAGETTNPNTGNDDLIITKTDDRGNIIWSKIYNSRLWSNGNGSADYFYVHQMQLDTLTGDVFITGPFWVAGSALIRFNPNTASIVWSKSYSSYGDFNRPIGFDILANEIKFFSRSLYYNVTYINMCRINKVTGDTLQNKYVVSNDTSGYKIDILNAEPLVKLNNGNYTISGRTYGTYEYNWNKKTPLIHSSVLEFDSNFNPINAYCFKGVVESSTSRVTVQPDGSGLFSAYEYVSSYSCNAYVVQFKNGQVLRQRIKKYRGEALPWEPLATRLPNGGDMIVRMLSDSAKNKVNIEFIQFHVSDTASECIGNDETTFYIYPFKMKSASWGLDSVRSNVFKESITKTIVDENVAMTKLLGCYTVSYCDSLKLIPSQKTLCISQDLQITIRKNITCGSNVYWQYDTSAVSSTSQLNDSTKKFTFKKSWSGYIYGSIKGCDIITDSVFVQVVNAPSKLDLGSDFEICPNNTRILNAHSGYTSYLWQDGTKDSIFTVTMPGKYFVTTTSACGGIFSDTVVVNQHAPVFINLGGNRSKCNSDTIHINAPSGFINYYWSNSYNLYYTSDSIVIVNPLIDTFYAIKAEKEPGCFAYDTVKIVVNKSPKIYLGNDTSLCKGDSLIVNVGTGFVNYVWNNGSTNPSLTLSTQGQYYVIATTAFGCKSSDTINILSVFNLPAISLDHNNELCEGTSRILDAGNYKSYLWQDGSRSRQLKVNSIGQYYVKVIDANNCVGTDTTIISNILPLPSSFLPMDTSICSYGKLTIQPNQDYSSYLWNTNSILKTIVIEKPGIYWLDVKDSKNCVGRDSINVKLKQCMKGLYVPSAFTPNNDGKNDKLKALIFGDVASFNFTIYNRFGQKVFETNYYTKGWDGRINGIKQNIGNYVWVCRYQFVGEQPAIEKGTIILIN